MSAIIKKVASREEPEKKAKLDRKLGGTYVVTHGRVVFGSSGDQHAFPGDIVELDHEDAANMLEHDVVEKYVAPPPEDAPAKDSSTKRASRAEPKAE